jgi:two-component system cell cycle sensor histidine kinase/response regulator CckA
VSTQQFSIARTLPVLPAFPPAVHVFGVGFLCVLASFAMPLDSAALGLLICGGILCAVAAGVAGLRMLFDRVAARQRAWADRFMAHELGVGFVTNAAGVVYSANAVAMGQFSDTKGRLLADIFGHILANPASVLSNLVGQAQQGGAGSEDIVTRSGHFRMRVLVMGHDCQLWWLEDLNDGTARTTAQTTSDALPRLHISAAGQVTKMNTSMRALLGDERQNIEDIVVDLPIRSGQVHRLDTPRGPVDRIVAQSPLPDGGCALFLLPGSDLMSHAPQLHAGWDAIDDLPVPLLDIATDGRILGSNREARHLLGTGSTEGRKLSDVLEGPGRPINDWLSEVMTGHGGNVSEFLRGKGDKQDTFVQVTLSQSGTSSDLHLIAVLNDVTELKTLEAQFVQSQKMQAIGQLAGGVAHDFNNLLTAISGHCDLLLLRHDEGDQNYGDLIQIHQNANRAASLVGQLLAFSRKQNLQLETIDLRDTLSDLTHLLNRLVGEKVTLVLDHDPQLSRIRADRRQLEQVLMNLVVNARDAIGGAGDIRVVTQNISMDTEMRRDRAVVPAGDYVVVSVIDKGQGIAPEKLHKIFEPFYTTKRIGEGTGLGLSTAYGIVKQTGGFIFAESEQGEGSTFSLFFPQYHAVEVAKPQVSAPVVRAPQVQLDGVVLLVEDEAPVRAFASRALRLKGYTVLEADSAETALEMLRDTELAVDIFVTDVIMPGLDGPTWVRKALKDRPATKVIFVSGYPEDAFDDGEAAIPNAIFLPKPFSLTALTETVQGQLQAQVSLP